MKNILSLLIIIVIAAVIFTNCNNEKSEENTPIYNFSEHEVPLSKLSNMEVGSSYLSVYSEIYSNTEKRTHSLTVTVSIRNTSLSSEIYISKADYFDTHGKLMTNYIKKPIVVAPLETIEIVIDKSQTHGGTGGNFLFDWHKDSNTSPPIFEGVMISTSGQQGISFTTHGVTL